MSDKEHTPQTEVHSQRLPSYEDNAGQAFWVTDRRTLRYVDSDSMRMADVAFWKKRDEPDLTSFDGQPPLRLAEVV